MEKEQNQDAKTQISEVEKNKDTEEISKLLDLYEKKINFINWH